MATVRLSEDSAPQFTPGPWNAWTNEATGRPRVRVGSYFWSPGYYDGESTRQHIVDARAIAALPALYGALAAMLEYYGPPLDSIDYPEGHPISLARAALSSARGEQGK